MHPILWSLGPVTVYSYGAMIALGFVFASLLASLRAPSFGIDRQDVVDFLLAALLGGIIGGRALYVILNLHYYRAVPFEVIDLTKGGLVWYGAFAGGLAAALGYLAVKRLAAWKMLDLIAPYLALAQALGRIGCFLNGCCFGTAAPAGLACAVTFPGSVVPRQPTQLYASAALVAIFIILLFWQERRRFSGEIFLGYAILYAVKRFGIEFLRGDNARIFSGLTFSQCISVCILGIAVVLFIARRSAWKKNASRSP